MASKRFDNAISALVEAFFKGTLAKATCCACACGNIIAKSNNIEIPKDIWFKDENEHRVLATRFAKAFGKITGRENAEINKTGYSLSELNNIEDAFEDNTLIKWIEYRSHSKDEIMQDQYNGLMAVVDVLCEIEGIESAEYKKMFEYSV